MPRAADIQVRCGRAAWRAAKVTNTSRLPTGGCSTIGRSQSGGARMWGARSSALAQQRRLRNRRSQLQKLRIFDMRAAQLGCALLAMRQKKSSVRAVMRADVESLSADPLKRASGQNEALSSHPLNRCRNGVANGFAREY